MHTVIALGKVAIMFFPRVFREELDAMEANYRSKILISSAKLKALVKDELNNRSQSKSLPSNYSQFSSLLHVMIPTSSCNKLLTENIYQSLCNAVRS
ncbi:CLUMA_CG004087, isoform A [Clunio marinus]|uniref:CLUMA_CG004087, isoform A n=1 Tax=Clunio marinus TaxID=568069 RepID=A0A1J1HSB0_9DIPT|nr:CLUMA_CG004087, isoform A [Clunio marinus]